MSVHTFHDDTVHDTTTNDSSVDALCNDYRSGNFTQSELAVKYGMSLPLVNRILKKNEVKPPKRKYTYKNNKYRERNASIIEKWKAGASTRHLAEEFGVTHQNISLIIAKAGFSPLEVHKERMAAKAAARSEIISAQKQAKIRAKEEKIKALSDLWKSGAPISEIGKAAGLKSNNAAQVKIVLLRRKYPDMFPKRSSSRNSSKPEHATDSNGDALKESKAPSESSQVVKSVKKNMTKMPKNDNTVDIPDFTAPNT